MLPEQDFHHKHAALINTVSWDLESRLGVQVPSIHTDLFESGYLDSLSFMSLLVYIESEHSVAIDFAELDWQMLRSVESICRLIASQSPDSPREQAPELGGWMS